MQEAGKKHNNSLVVIKKRETCYPEKLHCVLSIIGRSIKPHT